ncbi:MAG: 2-dehydropantoate 2-reductase [Acidobacteriota bacterium]
MRKDPETVAVFGAGAVGCYFGGMLARSGVSVTLIGRARHVDAIAAEGLLLKTTAFTERVRVAASTDTARARAANLVLVAVKTWDTQAAARSLAPHLAADATVLSLQNGVENAALLRAGTGHDAFPAVVWVAAEMTGAGALTHSGRGDLVIGDETPSAPGAPERRSALDAAAALFARAGVPCAVSENVAGELWAKLAANCAYNAVSALGRAHYGRVTANPDRQRLLEDVVGEVLAVAAAGGVELEGRDVLGDAWRLGTTMAKATSSMAQDLARGRRTEIDALNGFVVRRGEALSVPTPVNRTLTTLVKLLEEART